MPCKIRYVLASDMTIHTHYRLNMHFMKTLKSQAVVHRTASRILLYNISTAIRYLFLGHLIFNTKLIIHIYFTEFPLFVTAIHGHRHFQAKCRHLANTFRGVNHLSNGTSFIQIRIVMENVYFT